MNAAHLRESLLAEVKHDDGSVRYCPDCGMIGVLGWCSHGFDSMMMLPTDRSRRITATVPDDAISFAEDEDRARTYYAWVNLEQVKA